MYGTQVWLILLGCVWGALIVIFLILPVFYPLNFISICEYLDIRFQSPFLKKLSSLILIFNSFVYLGVCLYTPAIAFSSATGIPTFVSLAILGGFCAVYITLGGVRAVVYTDVVQTLMMFVGVLVVVIQVTLSLGGISKVWNIAGEGGRLQSLNMDPNPFVRHTFWSVQFLGMQFIISISALSQAQYQRLMSVKSLRISQSLVVVFTLGLCILWSLFYYSGLVAYAAYVNCDPFASGKLEKADQILPYMVGDKLSNLTGMAGIFEAAVAGAVLSSLSTHANCMVVLLWEDFLSGWWIFARVSPDTAIKITKILSSIMILQAIFSALLVAKLGTIFQAGLSMAGAIMGPLSGLFITAITAPWVNTKGAISGLVASLTITLWIVMGKFYYGAGQGERLPLSTEGCLLNRNFTSLIYNITHGTENNISMVPSDSTLLPNEIIMESSDRSDYLQLYDISYCYLGSLGVILVFIISSTASLFTVLLSLGK